MASKMCLLLVIFVLFTCYYQNVEGSECFNIYGDNLATSFGVPKGIATSCPNWIGKVMNSDYDQCCHNIQLKPYCCTKKEYFTNIVTWISIVSIIFSIVGGILRCLCC